VLVLDEAVREGIIARNPPRTVPDVGPSAEDLLTTSPTLLGLTVGALLGSWRVGSAATRSPGPAGLCPGTEWLAASREQLQRRPG